MLGKNKIQPPELKSSGNYLKVNDIFYTIQGEGPFAGIPALFIRLAGCNLACKFCDTEFDDFQQKSIKSIIKKIETICYKYQPPTYFNGKYLVVITGGEPLRQNILLLCQNLIKLNFKIQIETNGILYQQLPKEVNIICSPKCSKSKFYIHPKLKKQIVAYKFLISAHLKNYKNVPILNFMDKPIFIQPIDEYDLIKNQKNIEYIKKLALKNGYRISLQLHKILNIK